MTEKLTLTFHIALQADYHISAGSGKGSELDSALLRDGDGVPKMGGTIAGLLREGLGQLLRLQPLASYPCHAEQKQPDDDAPESESTTQTVESSQESRCFCPLCQMLGTPYQQKRWQISAARPVGIEKPLSLAQDLAGQKVARVRIDPRTGRAAEGQLFSQENGAGLLTFAFTATAYGSQTMLMDEAALLVAAARNVRALGRSRRRGSGACQITVVSAEATGFTPTAETLTQEALLDRFQQRWLTGQVTMTPAEASPLPNITIKTQPTSPTKRFRLLIRTDEPLIVAGRSEAGNQFDTVTAIPGTTVRGAFAVQVARQHDLSQPAIYEQFVQLFERGQIQFPFLYPTYQSGPRDLYSAIPTPLDMLTCKKIPGLEKHQHGVVAQTTSPLTAEARCPSPNCEADLQALSDYMTLAPARRLITPNKANEMHIRIDPNLQRVNRGDLYGYVALSVGQYFVGELQVADETAWHQFQSLTGLPEAGQTFTLRLGKATGRGYGKVTALLQPCDNEESVWVRLPFAERVSATAPQILVFTLLTDTIVTDDWGRYRTSFTHPWLTKLLGLTIDQINPFAQVRPINSFHSYLGLPRQRDIALKAGSTVGLHLSQPLSDEQLHKLQILEQTGIGLRRNEGFGQVVFNHPLYHHQFRQIQGNALTVTNRQMQLSAIPPSHVLQQASLFQQDWAEEMERAQKQWVGCQDKRFAPLARWLQANADQPLETLSQGIQAWGNPNKALTQTFIADYGDRSKDNKINQSGLAFLVEMLNKMTQLQHYDAAHHSLGITLLADRLAAEAAVGEEGGNE